MIVHPRKLRVASGAGIGEVSLDQRAQAKALVQLAGQQQPGVGRDRGPLELDTKLGVEREANWARFRVTHWVVPSVPARSPREPRLLRALSDYSQVRSAFKLKMRVKGNEALTRSRSYYARPAERHAMPQLPLSSTDMWTGSALRTPHSAGMTTSAAPRSPLD
jgi:hypothetical protein